MSFISNFKTIIENDSSINSIIPVSRIKYSHLPTDWEIHDSWLVWDYLISEQVNCMNGNNAFSYYTISITITLNDSVQLATASKYVIDYLNSTQTDEFIDIVFITDRKITDLSKPKPLYQNTLTFIAIYIGD